MTAALVVLAFLAAAPGGEAAVPAPAPSASLAADDAAALDAAERAIEAAPNDLFLGADYRQEVIALKAYDRAIAFFQKLTAAHPEAANAWLNLGYAYVDEIPDVGAVTAVILANTALGHFSKAVELEETWLARYTRGNSYLYWPAIFGRTPLGVADLERAIELAETLPPRPYHARAWAALGDARWRLADPDGARKIWSDGLARYPGEASLEARLARQGADLDAFLEDCYAVSTRVETHLREMREDGR